MYLLLGIVIKTVRNTFPRMVHGTMVALLGIISFSCASFTFGKFSALTTRDHFLFCVLVQLFHILPASFPFLLACSLIISLSKWMAISAGTDFLMALIVCMAFPGDAGLLFLQFQVLTYHQSTTPRHMATPRR